MNIVDSYFKPLEHILDGSYCNYRDIKPVDIAIIATYATIIIPLGFFAVAVIDSYTWAPIQSKVSYTYLAQYILASNGNSDAQYELGNYYYYREDKVKGADYYRLAADQGHKRAQYDLATLYFNAENKNEECKEALKANGYEMAKKYFTLAADENGDAYYFLGQIAERENNPQEALTFYRKCVDGKGHYGNYYYFKSAALLANEYKKKSLEHKIKGEKKEAFEFLKKAADLHDYEAGYLLAMCYETGEGVKANIDEAFRLYVKLKRAYEPAKKKLQEHIDNYQARSDTGDAVAICVLGFIRELENHDYEARELYKKAAEMGNKQAQYNLGYCNYQDAQKYFDKAKYYKEAKFWFEKAAAQGLPQAKDGLETIKREENND